MIRTLVMGGFAAPFAAYFGAPQIAFDTPDRAGGGGLDVKSLMEAFEKRDKKLIDEMAALQVKMGGTVEQLAQLEQRIAQGDHFGGGTAVVETIGEQFVKSDSHQGFRDTGFSKNARSELLLKATLTSATSNAAGSVGALTSPHRDPDIVGMPKQPLRVRDLLPSVRITQGSVEYMAHKARNLNPGMVAEGAAKPESDVQMELKTASVRTIAHWMKASRQILDDAPQLAGFIDTELLYGLALKEDGQLLQGDGTGQNLLGMIPQATAFSAPFAIDDATMIDTVGLAILQSALAEYPADGVIMNPGDWMRIRLTKDGDGNYIYGPPSEAVVPVIFGVPVVPTPAMAVDKFMVGQFQVAGTIYDRWEARIEAGFVNDDFTRNLVTVLGEERLAFAVKRPLALTYGDFGNVT